MDDWFQVDPRGIFLWRRLLGCILLLDLSLRGNDLEAHYSDHGVLPRDYFVDLLGGPAPWLKNFRISGQYLWSVLFLDGSKEWALGTFVAAALGAVLLISGRLPRLASWIAWIFLTSIQSRNPLINSGGDTLLRLMLFWSILQPSQRGPDGPTTMWAKIPSLGLLCQIVVVYGVTAWLKFGDAWVYRGYAIRDALEIQAFARPLAGWLLDQPRILPTLTRLTWCLEAVIPLLIFGWPSKSRARIIAFVLIVGLQLGIACVLDVGLFQPIAIIAAVPILPKALWDFLETGGSWTRVFFRPIPPPAAMVEVEPQDEAKSDHTMGFRRLLVIGERIGTGLSHVLSATALVLVMTRQVDALFPSRSLIPRPLRIAGEVLRLDQYWGMFAPSPPRAEQGTFSYEGDVPYKPGIAFDATGKATEPLFRAFLSDRWRKLYLNLTHDGFKAVRPALKGYLLHAGRDVDVIFTGRDGRVVRVTAK
jgi:hypothetical protein